MIMEKQKNIAKVLLFSKDHEKILLIKTKWGYWDLPGGHLEFEESPEECLNRETKEEVGLDIIIKRLHAIQTVILDGTHLSVDPEITHYSVFIFIGEISNSRQKISLTDQEIIDWRWFKKKSVSQNMKIKMLDFNKDLLGDLRVNNKIKTMKKYYIKVGKLKSHKKILLCYNQNKY